MANCAKIADTGQPRVVVVGGGFGGMELVKALAKADVQVILIDKQNFHTFQPLLYQVATTGVEPDSIVHPFRKIFYRQENFYFRLAEVQRVDTQQQVVETSIGLIRYDYLVLANGATTNFLGNDQMEQKAISMKNMGDALTLRNTILCNFENALQLDDEQQLNSLMVYGPQERLPTTSPWWLVLATPDVNTPFSVASSLGTALAVVGACQLLARRFEAWLLPLAIVGAMTLTLYYVHLVFLSLGVHYTYPVLWWAANVLLSVLFALAWHRAFGQGPVERLMNAAVRPVRRAVLGRTAEQAPTA